MDNLLALFWLIDYVTGPPPLKKKSFGLVNEPPTGERA
jgi:hypothetical protein